MKFKLFQYSIPAPEDLSDLNAFLAANRITSITRHLVTRNDCTMLVFVVEYTSGGTSRAADDASKIDYRNELPPAEFEVFSRLRAERKRIAEEEGLPVYAVFTNSQLAQMAKSPVKTLAQLAEVEGIGKARVDKYGARLLPILSSVPTVTSPPTSPNPPPAA